MKKTWQREPLLIRRQQPDYYKGLFSTAEIDDILREHTLEYGENIDLTFYNPTTLKKERHNPEGLFSRYFNEFCSKKQILIFERSRSPGRCMGCVQRGMLSSCS